MCLFIASNYDNDVDDFILFGGGNFLPSTEESNIDAIHWDFHTFSTATESKEEEKIQEED